VNATKFQWSGFNAGPPAYYTNFRIRSSGIWEFRFENFRSNSTSTTFALVAWRVIQPHKLVVMGTFNPVQTSFLNNSNNGLTELNTYENKIVAYISEEMAINYSFYILCNVSSSVTFTVAPTFTANQVIPSAN
jgi:hypothetical protein